MSWLNRYYQKLSKIDSFSHKVFLLVYFTNINGTPIIFYTVFQTLGKYNKKNKVPDFMDFI